MTTYLTCAETAKLIRKAIKAAFPGIKFSVRSDTYAGGSSIDVRWTDGPTAREVDAIVQPFAGCTFDGMRDLKEYKTTDLPGCEPGTRSGANFVFTKRTHGPERRAEAERRVAHWFGFQAGTVDFDTRVWRHLSGADVLPEIVDTPAFANDALAAMGA